MSAPQRERPAAQPEVDPVEVRIAELIAIAPPLSASQRSRLRVLLTRPARRPGDTGAAA